MLILIELHGGNDGLNTAVPIDDSRYHQLWPRLALRGDAVVPLVPGIALHAPLAPWLPLWTEGEMALLQGVGYPEPNLSHFRSIEIWDTASSSSEVLPSGWLTRAVANSLPFRACAADGVTLGAAALGPLMGGVRAVALADGNLPYSLDFRSAYATILERWWGLDAPRVLGKRFAPVEFVDLRSA